MNNPKCHRCETKPANLGSAFFIQVETDGKTNETEYHLCIDCFNDLWDFLDGKTTPNPEA